MPSSPTSPHSPRVVMPDDIGQWELVPYDVPWGSEYYHYKAGTLPGPDGKCLFLRSPTPIEKRRAPQACRMCRERKAKCSGTHPTCQRCLSRGLICEYALESRRKTKATPHQRLRSNHALFHPYSRRHSDTYSVTSSTDSSGYASSSSPCFSPKHEEQDFVLSDTLQYPPSSDSQSPSSGYWTPESSDSYSPQAIAQEPEHNFSEGSESTPPITASIWNGHDNQQTGNTSAAPAFHAPRPLRYSHSMPFLSSTDQTTLPTAVPARTVQEESSMAMDPQVILESSAVYLNGEVGVETSAALVEARPMDPTPTDYYADYCQDTNALMLQYTNTSGYTDESDIVYLTCPPNIFAPPEAYVANQAFTSSRDSLAYQRISSSSSLA